MIYHAVFYLTPLSFVCMICVCLIAFVHPKILLPLLLVLTVVITKGDMMEMWKLSSIMMITLYPISIWVTLI